MDLLLSTDVCVMGSITNLLNVQLLLKPPHQVDFLNDYQSAKFAVVQIVLKSLFFKN